MQPTAAAGWCSLLVKLNTQVTRQREMLLPAAGSSAGEPWHQGVQRLQVLKKWLLAFAEENSEGGLGSPEGLELISGKCVGIRLLGVRKVLLRSTTTALPCS